MRSLDPIIIQRLLEKVIRPVLFIFADFATNPQRLWTGCGDILFMGETWKGIGALIGFETIPETVDTSSQGITAKLNGLDTDIIAALIGDDYQGREATIFLGFWDENRDNLEALDDPLWRGILDTDSVKDNGKTSELSITAENELVDQLRRRDFRYNQQSQNLLHPVTTDTGLNKIESIQDVKIAWGRQ